MHPHARKIARIMREFNNRVNAGLKDPMTQHYGAGEFVWQSSHAWVSKQLTPYGLGIEAAHDVAIAYSVARRAKRLRYKNPARLAYLAKQSIARGYGSEAAAQ